MKHTKETLAAQRRLIVGYLASLSALCVAIALMPTKLLVWNGVYGHSILFWVSLLCTIFCYFRFKRKSQKHSPKFSLCRSRLSQCLLLLTVAALVPFVILQGTMGSVPHFILFAVCIFLLGLYLGANSYEYHIYRKHRKSHVRRDEI